MRKIINAVLSVSPLTLVFMFGFSIVAGFMSGQRWWFGLAIAWCLIGILATVRAHLVARHAATGHDKETGS